MDHFSKFMNPRISSVDVNSSNNVLLIPEKSFCFGIELSEAQETILEHRNGWSWLAPHRGADERLFID
jgi:hypothetical protein